MPLFANKIGLIMGIANERSIAWAISDALRAEGAELAYSYGPRPASERHVPDLLESLQPKLVMPCNVQNDDDIAKLFAAVNQTYGRLDFLVHSIAFAPPKELHNPYMLMSRPGWHLAMDASVYSFVAVCREASALMKNGGSIITITYYGGEKVIPGYNVMGVCKAALEHSVRYLAWDLGRQKVRVNAISSGPILTLSASGVSGFNEMSKYAATKSPLGRALEPKEIGSTAIYLLSDLSSAVTGETIHVDCGYSIVGI
jgi:enoyl-[acyl-carrier protein] reductase I